MLHLLRPAPSSVAPELRYGVLLLAAARMEALGSRWPLVPLNSLFWRQKVSMLAR